MRLLLLGKSRYDIKGENNQQGAKGAKLYAVDLNNRVNDNNATGSRPIELDADYDVFEQIKPEQLPGLFDLSVTMVQKRGKENRVIPSIKAVAAMFVAPVKLLNEAAGR